jgi:hypothetical protein
MLGLGLGVSKSGTTKDAASSLLSSYISRVTTAGGYLEGNGCALQKLRSLKTQGLLNDASWVLIPEGIEEDIVYAQKSTNGLGDLTFTRASDATRTNSAGVIERTPWNLLTSSEMFTDATWTKRNGTISANVVNAPNGTLTADKIVEAATTGFHSILQSNTSRLGVAYTFSVYLKAAERTWALVWFDAEIAGAYVNLSTGELGTVSAGVTASVTSVGDGWYRCVISKNIVTGANVAVYTATSNGGASYVGNGTSGLFAWGAQLVEGTDAKPYFATTNRQDVPRLDYRNADGSLSTCPRLLLEPQRTNSIRNSTMVGAVAGSPGTLPTNWGVTSGGLTQTIVGVGTEDGLPYIDVRLNGTATGTAAQISSEGVAQIVAAQGQVWANSIYAKVISAPNPPLSYDISFREGDSGSNLIATGTVPFTPTSVLTRFSATRTLTGAATTRIQPRIQINLTNGAAYDFTIRIAAPQMELGATASTFIPTTTAAVTRLADFANKTGVSDLIGQTEGTFYTDLQISQTTTRAIFSLDIGTTTNYIAATTNTTNQVRVAIAQAGSATNVITSSALTLGRHKLAIAYKSGDYALYIDGVQAGTSSSTNFPIGVLSQIILASSGYGQLSDGYAQAALFPTRLTNAQLAQLTTL